MTLVQILGIEDLFGCGVLLYSALVNTRNAGLKRGQDRWALGRRFLYCSMSWAMFSLALTRLSLNNDWNLTRMQFLDQSILLFGIILFPFLRAVNFISQDVFLSFHGSGARSDRR